MAFRFNFSVAVIMIKIMLLSYNMIFSMMTALGRWSCVPRMSVVVSLLFSCVMAMRQRQWSFCMSIMGWWSFTVITMGCGCMDSGLAMITMSGSSMGSDSMKSGFSKMAVGFSLLPFNFFYLSKDLFQDLPPFPTRLVILGAFCCVALLLAGGVVALIVSHVTALSSGQYGGPGQAEGSHQGGKRFHLSRQTVEANCDLCQRWTFFLDTFDINRVDVSLNSFRIIPAMIGKPSN